MGLFRDLFDFNHDGELDGFEKAAEYATFASIMDKMEDDSDNEDETKLEMEGIDIEDLEFMDDDERREALEDAGLDPEDFDF